MCIRKISRLIIGAGLALAIGFPVQAQILEEIIVTARKRDESLQDTPASVQAFTAGMIDSIGISSMRDYANLIPNFFLVETQASAFTFVNIRGVTQFRNTDPSVAIVVDGVLSTSPVSMSQELFDVQQIEVLKGPQGALYGRNSLGGAINITTRRPGDEVEGFVRAGVGNGSAGKVQAGISGPLVEDSLYGRVAVSYRDSDGVRPNRVTGNNADAAENFSGRARLIWEASDTFEADLRLSFDDDTTRALQFIDTAPIFHEVAPGGPSLGVAVGAFPAFHPFGATAVRGGPTAGDLFVPGQAANVGNFDIEPEEIGTQGNLDGIDERSVYNISLQLNWDLDIGTLTSTTSWDKVDEIATGEQPIRTADRTQVNTQWRFSEAISQELRLTSPDDQPLRWIAGGYIVQTDTFLNATTLLDSNGFSSRADLVKTDPGPTADCVGNPFPLALNDPGVNCTRSHDSDSQDNLAYAVFGQINYDLTDTVELSLSARYDRDEREQTVGTPQRVLNRFQDNPDVDGVPNISFGQVRKQNYDSFQPKVTVRWMPQDNFMAYATYAEGFRSGGFNRAAVGALADFFRPISALPIVLGIEDTYEQQDNKGVEIGFKYNSPDNRFLLNAAGFYTEIDNYQTFTAATISTLLTQVIIPVDEVELMGFEVDGTARLTDWLSVNASFGLTESEVIKDTSRPTVGNKAPATPEYTFNFGGQINHPINLGGMDGEFFLRADWQRIGPVFSVVENFSERSPLSIVNARGGLDFENGWRAEVWVTNLTDEDYFAEMFNPAGFGFPGSLRRYGVEVTKRF